MKIEFSKNIHAFRMRPTTVSDRCSVCASLSKNKIQWEVLERVYKLKYLETVTVLSCTSYAKYFNGKFTQIFYFQIKFSITVPNSSVYFGVNFQDMIVKFVLIFIGLFNIILAKKQIAIGMKIMRMEKLFVFVEKLSNFLYS